VGPVPDVFWVRGVEPLLVWSAPSPSAAPGGRGLTGGLRPLLGMRDPRRTARAPPCTPCAIACSNPPPPASIAARLDRRPSLVPNMEERRRSLAGASPSPSPSPRTLNGFFGSTHETRRACQPPHDATTRGPQPQPQEALLICCGRAQQRLSIQIGGGKALHSNGARSVRSVVTPAPRASAQSPPPSPARAPAGRTCRSAR
jgi:hypothetical protein